MSTALAPATAPRAAVYCRVSQDRRAGRSVGEQEAESTAACAQNGWDVEEVFVDNDISASRFTSRRREDWERLVADLDAGRFDVLVLWEPSRGSRDLATWAVLLDACRRQRVLVHVTSHSHTYDLSRARDWRSLAEDGVDSAYESEKSSQRIKRAMVANAVAGRPHGRTAYGYTRRYDPSDGKLVAQELDPDTAPIVREVMARIAAAEPVIAIARDLDERGVPSPGSSPQWNRQTVRRIATNPVYICQREYAGETTRGDWPQLVEPATFYAAQRVLNDPARRTTRPGRYKYLLSYIATCGLCGAGLSAAALENRPDRHATYKCPDCQRVQCGVAWLDELAEGLVLARLDDPALLELLGETDDAEVVAARQQVAELRGRLASFRDAAANGQLTPASLNHIELKLSADIKAAEKTATRAGAPRALRGLVEADDVRKLWDAMPIASRREVVAALMSVQLDPSQRRGRHARDDWERVKVTWKTTVQEADSA